MSGRLDQAYRYVERGYQKRLEPPRLLSKPELKRTRARREAAQLTPQDAWYIHCCADPPEWIAFWFRLSTTAVRRLRECPYAGTKWTPAQKKKLSPTLAAYVSKPPPKRGRS
jgi:hypothetical protein